MAWSDLQLYLTYLSDAHSAPEHERAPTVRTVIGTKWSLERVAVRIIIPSFAPQVPDLCDPITMTCALCTHSLPAIGDIRYGSMKFKTKMDSQVQSRCDVR